MVTGTGGGAGRGTGMGGGAGLLFRSPLSSTMLSKGISLLAVSASPVIAGSNNGPAIFRSEAMSGPDFVGARGGGKGCRGGGGGLVGLGGGVLSFPGSL